MNSHFNNLTIFTSKYSFSTLGILICILCMLVPFLNYGQATDPLPVTYKSSDVRLESPNNLDKSITTVLTETISEPGAIWLRLFFDEINLGKNSTLTITSDHDGGQQTFTSSTIKDWKNSSAYFNGDKVTLTLHIAPTEKSVGLQIREIGVGIESPQVKSQCGPNDDRVDANDAAVGRIVPIGCTGWIIRNGRLVTAGHCVGSRAQLIEFNVPKSNPDRSIVHPGPEDQYPIGNFVTPYSNSPSPANDWAVFTASSNSQTGLTPIQAQGKSFNVVQSAPVGNIRITGFGTDTGIDNQTQQTHSGPQTSVNNTFVRYRTDTTGGNSGSPIIDSQGNAVGVHAYGGCSGSSGSNFGERATIPAFWQAMGLGNTGGPSGPIVRMVKRNASGFALDGGNGGANGQNVYLWSNNSTNQNQHWIEVNQGNGYYSYIKRGTNFALDGGNGGANRQNLYLWQYNQNNFNQHWRKVNVGGGNFRLEKRNASAFSIDGNNGGGNGQNTYLWSSNNNNQNQHWTFIAVNSFAENSTETIISENAENTLDNPKMEIYPNPATESFNIQIGNLSNNSVKATVFSIFGKKQKSITLKSGVNNIKTRDLGLHTGMYLIQVNLGTDVLVRKLIIH
ncbi:trypsin-like peptidase domain-containing protein [Aquimarina litoralis]|uniref:trypsin-like peptidase domain-containing protein n=1 Tax=Aquimarina litoralis TaxID=584605 RepID=UPI001C584547|nr:RICIN domain-containing protein [Aquimarina litoralis]MBW1295396.1 T9SS type A sorting domain-containing protein [Aquimarina litoralis]